MLGSTKGGESSVSVFVCVSSTQAHPTAYTVLLAICTGTVDMSVNFPVRKHLQLQADMNVRSLLCLSLLEPVGEEYTA